MVSLAKTTRPTLSIVINRERLFRKLDQDLDKKAVWIFGPPGSGKTTLMASYVEARDRVSLWYHMDGNDADVASFFFYLRQTAIKQIRYSENEIPQLPANVENWNNYGHQLFRAIFSRINEPLIIIFDNYESIPSYSDVHEVFRQVIDEVPNGSQLVFLSRTSPSPGLARPIANNLITVIDGDDLRIDKEECIQIAKIRKVEVTRDALEKILHSTAGWITGSIILLEYAKQSNQLEKRQIGAAGNILFDYMANEIFAGFDELTRKILLDLCWPRRLNPRIARAISGEDSAKQLLANLAKNNYFVTERIDNNSYEYIIHPILREFLQEKARELFNQKTLSKIQQKTADLLLNEGQTEEAVELMAGNLDWPTLEPVIIQYAPLLVKQGRTDLLASWMDELPHDRLNRNPWLLFWYGMARQKHAPREARHHFEQAFRKFSEDLQPDKQGKLLCCCGLIEVVLAEMDDFSLLDIWIMEIIKLTRDGTSIDESSYEKSADVLTLIALMIRKPDDVNINAWLSRAEESVRKQSYHRNGFRDLTWLTLVYLLAGDLVKAREKLDLLQYLEDTEGTVLKCQYRLLYGLYYILCGDGENAYTVAMDSLAIAEQGSYYNLLPFIYACACCAALTKNNNEETDAWIEKLASAAKSSHRLTKFLYHYILSWRALICEEVINSHHEQRRALNYAIELGMPYFEVLSRTAMGQLLYLCDDTRGVNAQLRRVHSIARDIKNSLLEFMTLLVYGDVAISQGRVTTGMNALRYALGLGRQHAYYHLPWWQTKKLSNVCAVALQNKIEIDYVRDFISRRSLLPVSASIEIPDWPWPYRINVLGEMAIQAISGQESEAVKNQGRPMQLLKVLIALGGRDVGANLVAETLWPHVDRDYGIKSMTINLHRLRTIFGNDDTITLRDGRLSINTNLVWLDVWALEHLISSIESAISMPGYIPDVSRLKLFFERLLDIYQRPFLNDDEEYPCFISARNLYRAEFIKGLNLLIDTMHTHDTSINVPDLYEQAMQKDPYAESIYRRLMLWYLDADRQADAMDTYDRCRIAMARTSQQVPNAETQSIYNKLVKYSG